MIEIKFAIMVLCSVGMMAKFHPAMYANKVVTIEGGRIVGEERDEFFAYRGIPYAESPVGDLRFAPPKKYSQTWKGLRRYENFSEVCAQYDHFGYIYEGSEDCLTLNVFVPKSVVQSYRRVPVIFFVHGGAFMYGGGKTYGPEILMHSHNLILVTVNYRLGVLGFLSTEDEAIPGNFGMKDQVEALRWVKQNIEAFNGDPEKVTIVGFSAGGASVQLHYMSPLTDGLFNNGISHSGVAINPWVMMENAKEKAHALANSVNCPKDDHNEMLKCLRGKPAEQLVMFAKKYQPFLYNPFSPFGVVVEPASETAFITDHPLSILKNGQFKKLPWFLSQTLDEGLYPAAEFYDDEILAMIDNNWDEFAPFIFDFNETTKDGALKLEFSRKIHQFYLNNQTISKSTFQPLLQAITDRLYHNGAYQALQLQSKHAPTYFYLFRVVTKTGIVPKMQKNAKKYLQRVRRAEQEFLGISHGDDVFLIYFNPGSRGPTAIPYSEEEKTVGRQLINLYHRFAYTNTASYGNHTIRKVEPSTVNCLEIFSSQNFSLTQKNDEFGNQQFWNELQINDN